MERKTIGILFSGGLESTCLVSHYKSLEYDISLVYIKYGYIWENIEIRYAKRIAKYYKVKLYELDYSRIFNTTQLGLVKNKKQNIIPLRNLSLLVSSALFFFNIGILKLAIGIQKDLNYPDTDEEYLYSIEKLISKGLNITFKIETPFYNDNKKTLIEKYTDIPLKLIFSCTNPINNKRCHSCYKCNLLDNLINDI